MIARSLLAVSLTALLAACMAPQPRQNDPSYAPVLPMSRIAPENNSGSLYQAGYGLSLYEDRLARRVGDVITVLLQEQTSAKKSNSNKIKKTDKNSGSATVDIGVHQLGGNYGIETDNSRDFSGEADADQSNSLRGSITVTVTDVLPSGVLLVKGEKWMTLTDGDEFIRVSGMVRPEDVRPDNTVLSSKLADARISYSATGAQGDAVKKGWGSRVLSHPWWPF